ELLGYSLFGVPLDAGLFGQVTGGGLGGGSVVVFALVIAVIAAVAYLTRRTLPVQTPSAPSGGMNTAGMAKVLSYLPFMTAVIAAIVPLAAGLYLATTTTWTLAERLILKRRYPVG